MLESVDAGSVAFGGSKGGGTGTVVLPAAPGVAEPASDPGGVTPVGSGERGTAAGGTGFGSAGAGDGRAGSGRFSGGDEMATVDRDLGGGGTGGSVGRSGGSGTGWGVIDCVDDGVPVSGLDAGTPENEVRDVADASREESPTSCEGSDGTGFDGDAPACRVGGAGRRLAASGEVALATRAS